MKKISALLIVIWSVLACIGIAWLLVTTLAIKWPAAACWWPSIGIWAGAVLWIVLRLVPGRGRAAKGRVAYAGNQAVYQRVSREVKDAAARYCKTVTARGLFKKKVLYEKPWFLLCGTKKSGKSSLLKGSGLNFPVTSPSEADGLMVAGADQTVFYFANEAVWIDTPGSYAEDAGREEWRALAASLLNERPLRPIDGVAMVVNAQQVLNSNEAGIRDMARTLRSRVDEIIALWGIEFPVYLIFNHADEIPGFKEYFGDLTEKGQNQVLGATIKVSRQEKMPRAVFAEEFGLLSRSLTDLRLDRLGQERNEAVKRMVCRFVIHFEGMQEKLGALVAELFKPSSYVGKPLFRGFYFTSCREFKADAPAQEQPAQLNISNTIANHPLNPKRMMAAASSPKPASKAYTSSAFVLPLFRKIMVRDKALVKTTQQRSRKELALHYAFAAVIALATAVLGWWMIAARNHSAEMLRGIQRDMAVVGGEKVTILDHYRALDVLRKNLASLQDYDSRFFRFSWGFYKGKKVLEGLRKSYAGRARPLVIDPAIRYLEYTMGSDIAAFGELTGDQYSRLYGSLKLYLSLSEAVAGKPQDIDTAFMRTALTDALGRALLTTLGQSRLPEQLEIQVNDNIGMVLLLVKSGRFPLFQENQRLVADARQRLQRLPDAQTIYATVINRLITDAPERTLDEMLGRQGEGILKSDKTMSILFTQDGWDRSVGDAIDDAAKNPFSIDWVLGITRDQVPESMLDTRKFRDDMINAYVADCRTRWLAFLSSLTMDPFGDLDRSARLLQKLVAARSELEVVLETVANGTIIKPTGAVEDAAGKALGAASQFKGTKKMAAKMEKQMNQAENTAGALGLGMSSPLDQLNATFDPLRAFVRSTSGALGGFQGYRDKVLSLASKCASVKEQGEQSSVGVFNGRDDDPLLSCWRFTQNELAGMPAELSAALQGVLVLPVTLTGDAVAQALTRTLNAQWQDQIVKPYTSRFSGRYPFDAKGEEATFNDVMDFFRPSTGAFWGFNERVLSPYVVKTPSGWMVRSLGSITLSFNPALAATLSQAERIRDIFFKPDGTLRSLGVTITPSPSDKNAKLEVNGQSLDLTPGKSGQLYWPLESPAQGATLKVYAAKDFTQDMAYGGAWGFLKLLAAARVNAVNASAFSAKWQVNVQNMYVIQLNWRVQVSAADHPFADRVFEQFNVPTDLLIVKPPAQNAAAATQPPPVQ